jgi:hypothetical protein
VVNADEQKSSALMNKNATDSMEESKDTVRSNNKHGNFKQLNENPW